MTTKSSTALFVAGCLLIGLRASADPKSFDASQLPPASSKQGVTFDADVKPIFEKSCFPCHGPKTAKPKGKLRLDTAANVIKGGEDAPNIVVGDSSKSPLVAAI